MSLEVFTLTEDNVEDVAKACGRRPEDLKLELIDPETMKPVDKPVKIWVEKPDIPEGFGMR